MGWFVIEEINNQYNNHFYRVSLNYKEGSSSWLFRIWNHPWKHTSEECYKTEQEAADALTRFVTKFKVTHLKPHAERLKTQHEQLQKTIAFLDDLTN